jgi:hypothetical protein
MKGGRLLAKRDLYHNINEATNMIPFAARTATVAIAAAVTLDTYGYYAIVVEAFCGTITDGTHALALYESDTDVTGNYTLVAAGDLIGAFGANLATGVNAKVGYIGSKRYLRVVDTVAGTTTGGVYGVVGILGYPMHKPVAGTA